MAERGSRKTDLQINEITIAKAIKFRLGARMRYDDASTTRDLALIPLTRKTFGAGMAIHAGGYEDYLIAQGLAA